MPRDGVRIEESVDVDAPPEVVWRVMSDVERWHEWTESITHVRLLDPGPLRVGSRARIKQPRVPALVWRITAIEPGVFFTWETKSPGALTIGDHRVVARAGGGSRATLAVDQTGFAQRLLRRWIEPMSRRYVAMEAAGLKRRCEAGG